MTNNTNPRKLNKKIVKYSWYVALTVVLVLFLRTYLIITTPLPSQEPLRGNPENIQPLPTKNLGLTADEFQNSFNTIAKENKLDLQIKSLPVQKGLVQNTFQYMLTDDIVLIGNVEGPTNLLQKISVLSTSTETISSSETLGPVINLVIFILNPTLPIAEQAKLQKDLGLVTHQVSDVEMRHGEKHYFYKPSNKLGTLFVVSPTP